MTATVAIVSMLSIVQPAIVADQTKVTPMGGMAEDNFGGDVAISGDIAVIGAQGTEVGGDDDAGAAYVYERTGGTWTRIARLTVSNGAIDDYFGYSVDIDGDTIVVGAPNGGVTDVGHAYVFVKPNLGWANMTETARLTASDGAMDDQFGFDVAIDGDTIVVGTPLQSVAENGAVYLFEKPNGGWVNSDETAKLSASDASQEDRLGISVDIQGDTVVAGCANTGNTGVGMFDGPGGVYVYVRPNAGWANMNETAKLTASDGSDTDFLGYDVGIDGDTIVSGAVNDGNTGGGSQDGPGSAYVFVRPEGGWVDAFQNARLVYSTPESTGFFGFSIAIHGNSVLVGASNRNHTPAMQDGEGAAYLFTRPDGGWSGTLLEDEELFASDAALDRFFGYRVEIVEDWLLIGSPNSGTGMTETGSAYFFSLDDDGDGAANHIDNCPNDANKLDPGVCGCNEVEMDSDGDGIFDCVDPCPADASGDSDGDGVCDSTDTCPGSDDAIDTDGDGTPDGCDDQPMVANTGDEAGDVLPGGQECCGGGVPAMMPFMFLGWKHRRRRRRSVEQNPTD